MKKALKSTVEWIFFGLSILVLLFLFFIVFGCDSESPEIRFADSVGFSHVGDEKCDYESLGEGGRVVVAGADTVAFLKYADGTRIQTGGLRFSNFTYRAEYQAWGYNQNPYWVDCTPSVSGHTAGTTNSAGYCKVSLRNTLWGLPSYSGVGAGGYADVKRIGNGIRIHSSGYKNRKDSATGELIPWKGKDSCYPTIYGGWYESGSWSTDGAVSLLETGDYKSDGVANNFSQGQVDFLANTAISVDSATIVEQSWLMVAGENGEGFLKEATAMTGLNHCERDAIQFKSTPYCFSASVALAESAPLYLQGLQFPATLNIGQSMKRPIMMFVKAVSEDGLRVVIQTEYIVPIDSRDYDSESAPNTVYDRWTAGDDPNDPAVNIFVPPFFEQDDPNHAIYDPNFVTEDGIYLPNIDLGRYVPVHCVPVSEGQRFRVSINMDAIVCAFPFISEKWLGDSKDFDLNRDGIVNYKDFCEYLRIIEQ